MRSAAPQGSKVPAVLASVRHGCHVCAFYETKEDLLDLVLPFFSAGRDRGELCVWMMPDDANEDGAKSRVHTLVERGLELRPARELYLRGGRFERDAVTRFWDEKVQQALSVNHPGVCASGDAFWLQQSDWDDFLKYEADLNTMIADKPITLLCTYPLTSSNAGDAFDVVRAHQYAIAKHRDEWEVIAAPAVSCDRHLEAVDAAARVSALSRRERQVLDAIIDGHPNKMVAHELGIDVRTVETHRARLMRRLGVRTMVEAVRLGTLAKFAG